MFHFSLGVRNPFRLKKFNETLFQKYGKLPIKNKAWETELKLDTATKIFDIYFDWSIKQSHAGIYFSVSVLWLDFSIELYDIRHWDYDADRWADDDAKSPQ
jgi:hypothetical protein